MSADESERDAPIDWTCGLARRELEIREVYLPH
jgi:hypothetical protein